MPAVWRALRESASEVSVENFISLAFQRGRIRTTLVLELVLLMIFMWKTLLSYALL